MITIYHNPRCSKSRETLALVEAAAARLDEPLQVVAYLESPPDMTTLAMLRDLLGLPVRAMIREGEAAYSELGLDEAALDDTTLLAAIAAHPVLLQRPVVVRGERAVIARPSERVLDILD